MSGSLENGRGEFDFRKRFSEISSTVEETGQFCVHGKLDPVPNPLLRVQGMPDILAWPLPPAQARELIGIKSSIASLGIGGNSLTFLDPEFDAAVQKLAITQVAQGLRAPVTRAKLRGLLLHEKGVKITRGSCTSPPGVFGRLFIILSSIHQGGDTIVSHGEESERISSSGSNHLRAATWIAFYGACEQEIETVTEGYRVSLVYDLLRDPALPNLNTLFSEITFPPGPQRAAHCWRQFAMEWAEGPGSPGTPPKIVHFLPVKSGGYSGWEDLAGADSALACSLTSSGAFDLFLAQVQTDTLPPHASGPASHTTSQSPTLGNGQGLLSSLEVSKIIPYPGSSLRSDVQAALADATVTDLCEGGFLQDGMSDGDSYGEDIEGRQKRYQRHAIIIWPKGHGIGNFGPLLRTDCLIAVLNGKQQASEYGHESVVSLLQVHIDACEQWRGADCAQSMRWLIKLGGKAARGGFRCSKRTSFAAVDSTDCLMLVKRLLSRQNSCLFERSDEGDIKSMAAAVAHLLGVYSFEQIGDAVVAFVLDKAQGRFSAVWGFLAHLCGVTPTDAESDQSACILDLDGGPGLCHVLVSRLVQMEVEIVLPAEREGLTVYKRGDSPLADGIYDSGILSARTGWCVLWKLRRADLMPAVVGLLRRACEQQGGDTWRLPALETLASVALQLSRCGFPAIALHPLMQAVLDEVAGEMREVALTAPSTGTAITTATAATAVTAPATATATPTPTPVTVSLMRTLLQLFSLSCRDIRDRGMAAVRANTAKFPALAVVVPALASLLREGHLSGVVGVGTGVRVGSESYWPQTLIGCFNREGAKASNSRHGKAAFIAAYCALLHVDKNAASASTVLGSAPSSPETEWCGRFVDALDACKFNPSIVLALVIEELLRSLPPSDLQHPSFQRLLLYCIDKLRAKVTQNATATATAKIKPPPGETRFLSCSCESCNQLEKFLAGSSWGSGTVTGKVATERGHLTHFARKAAHSYPSGTAPFIVECLTNSRISVNGILRVTKLQNKVGYYCLTSFHPQPTALPYRCTH
ncbi:hypothetical protein B484DRAFT_265966 [Ochromonadaceae sp. CCMP2298]|nr:hypothetical protein B484DRAFT_265966 [Ochromonadaceae sp. CCMP2298]